MATTVISEQDLKMDIIDFLKAKDTGALATSGRDTRVSPVRYFLGEGMDIYIHSDGGSKFDNLEVNNQVCFLASTEFYGDYQTIKGVQIFGNAEIGDLNSTLYKEGEKHCPFEHGEEVDKIIKITPKEIVYKDGVDGDGEKHRWRY
ncbi:pyridoxamine 5'-phosphate oxidase family protein [Halonatronum saccharophilum]|uniref:pyridoxamine 5'-phosphate oxidase family protein n=1 Tax=Halonatronum saccharophilum TaxID=150060 RepID=UPI000685106A|nr:pyridoxamine 5'-phosphate oxidase family protein [Halonatronum saccharophilum]